MEDTYRELAEDAVRVLRSKQDMDLDRALDQQQQQQSVKQHQRIVIAICGAPGSGKSTLASRVCALLGSAPYNVRAQVVGMDGFHLTRAQLNCMEDPAMAHARRGAPFTFDAAGVVDLVKRLKSGYGTTVRAPSFDHSIKDPVDNGIVIDGDVQIVLLEGLYLLLQDSPWNQIAGEVDARWFVNVSPSLARERVARRHLAAGIVSSIEDGYARADGNDYDNGQYLIQHSSPADRQIESVECI